MGAAGSAMSGAAALMGGNSNSNGTTNSSVSSGNLAYPGLSAQLSPTVGNVSQGSSYMASLLGIPSAPAPTSTPTPTPTPTGGGGVGRKAGLQSGGSGGEGPSLASIQSMRNDGIPGNYRAAMSQYRAGPTSAGPVPMTTPTPVTPTTPAATTPPMSQTSALQNFSDSAGLRFLQDNGTRMINNNMASKGLVQSGATLKGIEDYGQGLNSQYLNQYLDKVLQYTGIGQQAAGTLADAGKYMNSSSSGSTTSSSKQGLGI